MKMNNILLISEDTIKTNTSLNENVWGKNILPAIKTSQDIELKQIIGSCLLDSLCKMVGEGVIYDNELYWYKFLLDNYIEPYLIYVTLAHLTFELNTKLNNFGAVVSNDEHLVNLTENERELMRNQYIYYADSYAKQLQGYLRDNCNRYPELNCDCGCNENVKPNLDSAASTGLFLGGARGRIIK